VPALYDSIDIRSSCSSLTTLSLPLRTITILFIFERHKATWIMLGFEIAQVALAGVDIVLAALALYAGAKKKKLTRTDALNAIA
jgi:hypothetical protein